MAVCRAGYIGGYAAAPAYVAAAPAVTHGYAAPAAFVKPAAVDYYVSVLFNLVEKGWK